MPKLDETLSTPEPDTVVTQLGNSAQPQRIEALRSVCLTGVACGFAHTMLTDENGDDPTVAPWNHSPPQGSPQKYKTEFGENAPKQILVLRVF